MNQSELRPLKHQNDCLNLSFVMAKKWEKQSFISIFHLESEYMWHMGQMLPKKSSLIKIFYSSKFLVQSDALHILCCICLLRQEMFWAENQGNNQNFVPTLLPYNLWLICMGIFICFHYNVWNLSGTEISYDGLFFWKYIVVIMWPSIVL